MIRGAPHAQNGWADRASGNVPGAGDESAGSFGGQKMLAHAATFQIHLTQVITIEPSPAQPIHRDQWVFDFFKFPKGFEVQLNTIWAMTDFTAENGPRGHSEEPSVRRRFEVRGKGKRASRDGQGFSALLHRQRLSRRRRQPLGRDSQRNQSHLQPFVAAAGREPVPVGAFRGRNDFARSICCG